MFETSIVGFSGEKINLCSYDGNTALGGIDIDNAILSYVIREIERGRPGISIDSKERYRLNVLCRKAKEELSQREQAEIDIGNYVPGKTVSLSREQFNQLIEPIVEKIIAKTRNLVLKWKDSHPNMGPMGILLAGGSTEIPLVQERLKEAVYLSMTSIIPVCDVAALGCCEYGNQ